MAVFCGRHPTWLSRESTWRRVHGGWLCIAAVVGMVAVTLGLGVRNKRQQERMFQLLELVSNFYCDNLMDHSDAQRLITMAAVSNDTTVIFAEVRHAFAKMRGTLAKLDALYADVRTVDPGLHLAELDAFVEFYGEFADRGLDTVRKVVRRYTASHSTEFVLAFDLLDRDLAAYKRPMLQAKFAEARRALLDVSLTSTRMSVLTSFASSAVVMSALALACSLFIHLEIDTRRSQTARDKMVRQQAHEFHGRFAPAVEVLNVLSVASPSDLDRMRPDVQAALALLREIERQNRARLDLYKILRGTYAPKPETFDLVAFATDRLEKEATIAKTFDPHQRLSFYLELRSEGCIGCAAVHVRCDHYVLDHVVANCLSNARKHTNEGKVVLVFCGPDDGRLIFHVSDTGTGVPPAVQARLFDREVTTGGHRGTGLGLPSCHTFCHAVDGYITLRETTIADQGGKGGGSIFEFAVAGRLVSTEQVTDSTTDNTKLPPTCLPDDLAVVVVDDSASIRSAIVYRLSKVADQVQAANWTFAQYPTIEASQPHLRSLLGRSHTLVTLDQDMSPMGGAKSGTDAITWLKTIDFLGCIVSVSGDPDIGQHHIEIGAHFAWSKPLPPQNAIQADLAYHFAARS